MEFKACCYLFLSVAAFMCFLIEDTGYLGELWNSFLNYLFGVTKYIVPFIYLIYSLLVLDTKSPKLDSKLRIANFSLFSFQGVLYLIDVDCGKIGDIIGSLAVKAMGYYLSAILLWIVLFFLIARLIGVYISDIKNAVFKPIFEDTGFVSAFETNNRSIKKNATMKFNYTVQPEVRNNSTELYLKKNTICGIDNTKPHPKKNFEDEIIGSEEFFKTGKFDIPLGTNKDGKIIYADLAEFPHCIIGGSNKSGKSTFLSCIICSLLSKNEPKDLRFVMIDLKRVELGPYSGIPHLLYPVAKDIESAITVLKNTCDEMDRRNKLFEEYKARNIDSYIKRSGEKLHRIIVVIDEMAMFENKDNPEPQKKALSLIRRLAGSARSCGINLILCTQRPSKEVIEGVTKANATVRFAFQAASGTDSNIILDLHGAERLAGKGDMIAKLNGEPIQRFQTLNIDELTIDTMVGELESYTYIDSTESSDISYDDYEADDGSVGFDEYMDSLFGSGTSKSYTLLSPKAEEILKAAINNIGDSKGRISQKWITTNFKIGFTKARKIIEEIDRLEILLPAPENKPREITIKSIEEWEEFKKGFS